jgi:glucosylceramidase
MTVLHTEFPNKNIYFTEGSTFRTYGALRIISFFRNWAQSYNAWVTMLDQNGKPNNGPFRAGATCIVMNSDDLTLNYRFDHYMYGQFMKFVKRGAVRIYSDEGSGTFGNVAFKNPDGTIVLIGVNADAAEIQFKVASNGLTIKPTLGARSVATYVWHPN